MQVTHARYHDVRFIRAYRSQWLECVIFLLCKPFFPWEESTSKMVSIPLTRVAELGFPFLKSPSECRSFPGPCGTLCGLEFFGTVFQSPESLPRPSQPPPSPCMSQSEQLGLPAARTVAMLRDSRLRMFSLGPTKAHGSQHSNGHSKAGRKQTWHQRKRVTIATTMKSSSVRAQ